MNDIKQAKKVVTKTNPEYDLAIKRLHLYYNLKFVTFGIDGNSDLIIQLPVFVQPYSQLSLILYHREVPVPIIDQNLHANSYTEIQISDPNIALNDEIYISLRQQVLRS